MDRLLALERRHKIVIAQNYLGDSADLATRLYYLGTYLLIKGDHTYLNYFAGQPLQWFPEYGIPIGRPLGPLPSSVAALYDAGSGLYRRAYSNGLVVVNPGSAPSILALGHTYY